MDKKDKLDLDKRRDDIKHIQKKSPILELLGPDFWGYRSFDLRKQKGQSLSVGSCPGGACLILELENFNINSNPPVVSLIIDGAWFRDRKDKSFSIKTPLLLDGHARFKAAGGLVFDVLMVIGAGRIVIIPVADFLLVMEDN